MCVNNRLEELQKAIKRLDCYFDKSSGFQRSQGGRFYYPLKKPFKSVMGDNSGTFMIKAYDRETNESYKVSQDTYSSCRQSSVAQQYSYDLLEGYLDAQWIEAQWQCCLGRPFMTQSNDVGSVWLRVDKRIYVGLVWTSRRNANWLMVNAMYNFALINVGYPQLFWGKELLPVTKADKATMTRVFGEEIVAVREEARMKLEQELNIELFDGQ